ncbi:MAG: hypothetical protein KDA42_03730 [Planctomycetales bacterium]|nr:hypothetical protein [Planctomycetales bacterium]
MRLDYDRMDRQFRKYLETPQSEPVWEAVTNSVLFNIVAFAILLPVGLLLICTIVFVKIGASLVYASVAGFVTLEVFRNDRKRLEKHPEEIVPIVLASIIGSRADKGLFLGSFSRSVQEDVNFLARKAKEFGELYVGAIQPGAHEELVELLNDDVYIGSRRRVVPVASAEGRQLILFDVSFNRRDLHFARDDTVWIATAAMVKNRGGNDVPQGQIVQIPWSVVAEAVVI